VFLTLALLDVYLGGHVDLGLCTRVASGAKCDERVRRPDRDHSRGAPVVALRLGTWASGRSGRSRIVLCIMGLSKFAALFLADADRAGAITRIRVDQLFYEAFIVGTLMLIPGLILTASTLRAMRSSKGK